uniref:Uncharacterized protein n=1 Tax=Avena sativa TaxID=4498 RepID=A0ACD5X5I5_AVESA
MQAAGMMLNRFVFRRDDDGSFPDEATTATRAISSTSLGRSFIVALLPANPPAVSRLYVQWPRSPRETVDPEDKVTEVLTGHRRLFLLRTTSRLMVDKIPYRQDYFVFKAGSGRGTSWIKRLPPCTEPIVLSLHGRNTAVDRWFDADSVGLVHGSNDQYGVVQLAKFFEIPLTTTRKMGAELCVFSPSLSSSRGVVAEGKWNVLKLQICHSEEEFSDLQGLVNRSYNHI